MRIHLQGNNTAETEQLIAELQQDLVDNGLSDILRPSLVESAAEAEDATRSAEAATILTVLLAAVGAGGALSLAMGEGGFLTKLATVLEKYVDRKVDVSIEGRDGQRFNLSGSAGEIRDIISEIRPVILDNAANSTSDAISPTSTNPPPTPAQTEFRASTDAPISDSRAPYAANTLYGETAKPTGFWAKLMAWFR